VLDERRHITFSVGDYSFAIPIEKVREILNTTTLLPIPGGKEPLEGIIPYRERAILPVFSLLGFLGGQGAEKSDLVVVTGSEESPVGFRVSSMGGVLLTSEAEDDAVSYEGDLKAPDGVIKGVISKSGADYILLEIDRVFGSQAL
jgi:chemotaxis signal transduction protein